MKESFHHLGLAKLCGWLGVSRQAYYQNANKAIADALETEIIIKGVLDIRKRHKRIGGRKLYCMIAPIIQNHQIRMGRDRFFDLLDANNLLIRRKRRNIRTTFSHHWLRKYPNLIRGYTATKPNELWVSDITYWQTESFTVYISLITDAYSHRIVGYNLSETLHAIESVKALNKALDCLNCQESIGGYVLIHHSDRGVQYCSSEYTEILINKGISISMTESGDPLENAIAERANGILKEEYLLVQDIKTIGEAMRYLPQAIALYNTERPHMSIGNLTPDQVHFSHEPLKVKRLWRSFYFT
jgi:putative transposase